MTAAAGHVRPTLPGKTMSPYSRRAKYFRLKHRIAEDLESNGLPLEAESMRRCHEFEQQVICLNCSTAWYVPERCRMRLCPLCSWETSRERSALILALTRDMAHPKLITLTMPRWKGNPREGIKVIRKHFRQLRSHEVWERVVGGAYQIEVLQKPDGWHIHVHILADCIFIPQKMLWAVWKDILGIDCPQVDIRAAKNDIQRIYAAKYAAKSAVYCGQGESAAAWHLAVKGSRLWGLIGSWYKKSLEDILGDDEKKKAPRVCRFCQSVDSVALVDFLFHTIKDKEMCAAYEDAADGQGPRNRPMAETPLTSQTPPTDAKG